MKRFARPAALLIAAAVLLSLSGCYSGGIDQYYTLPQPSEEYLQLQTLINQEISSGSEYAAPVGGSYRQSVHMMDLDNDGLDEAMAFFRTAEGKLKIIVYTVVGKEYRQVLALTGEGRSIGSIDFADMNADGRRDLIVAWQIAAGMNLLSVYSLVNWSGELLLSTDSSEFTVMDLNGDGRQELMVLRGVSSRTYMADMYTFPGEREPQASSAALSAGIYELRRVREAELADGIPALIVESVMGNGDLVTDLLVSRDGSLTNLTLNRTTGVSETRRTYSLVYAQDIDGDGVTEIPHPQQLYSQGGEVFWSVAWYRYDSFGRASLALTTYHNVSDGWYLVLPSGWDVGLTVRRVDDVPGERALIFSRIGTDAKVTDLLAVYTITGENRSERARLTGRQILLEETATIFAAEALEGSMDPETVKTNFFRIYSEWSPGSH